MLLAYFSIHALLALDTDVLVEAYHKRHVNMTPMSFCKNRDRPNLFTFDKQLKCIFSLLESEASLFQGLWRYTETLNNPFLVCRPYISYISRFRSIEGGIPGLPSDFRKGMEDCTTLTEEFNNLKDMLPESISQVIMTSTMSILMDGFTKA